MGDFLNKYLEIDELEIIKQWLFDNGVRKEFHKDSFFFREGDLRHRIGYIESGSFRYVKLNKKSEKNQIVGYSFENDFVADYASVRFQKKATVSVQAINDSVVWVVTANKLNQFYRTCASDNIRSKVSESLFSDVYDRLLSFYVDSTEERYLKLLEKFPNITNLVSLKEIASFIKTTPETLSRIRRKLKDF